VRTVGVATIVALMLLVAACSSGGGSTHNSRAEICADIADLDSTAAAVGKANVADPTTFQKTLDSSVQHYVKTVRALRPLVPTRLHDTLDRLEAAVEQYQFDDALTARRELNDDSATSCPSSTSSSTTPKN
jgi:hypothetical protein